eukprot:jgi/Picsp_1/6345/NSC_03694-R1_protein
MRCAHIVSYSTRHALHPLQQKPSEVFIKWAQNQNAFERRETKVKLENYGGNLGWGLVANMDLEPDEEILSIPLEKTVRAEDDGCLPWCVSMAETLLIDLYKDGMDRNLSNWTNAMPTFVDIPWLHWNEEQIGLLGEPTIIKEVNAMRTLKDFAIEYLGNYHRDDVIWALSIVYSRTFISQGQHVLAPAIDMVNHDSEPTATVRIVHHPDMCQGMEAQAEIAPIMMPSETNSFFQLLACSEKGGIKKGENVTISYGKWPNEVLLLYFGWVPEHNPNDNVVIWTDLEDLCLYLSHKSGMRIAVDELTASLGQEIEILKDLERFIVTAEGIDGRIFPILEAARELVPLESPSSIIASRCKELLPVYVISMDHDAKERQGNDGSSGVMARRYKSSKQKILNTVLNSLT